MPPVLHPQKSRVDGQVFLGLSLARQSKEGHLSSNTYQTVFDLNRLLDRDYSFVASTGEDGWLAGGGEPGPPDSYKLASQDSAHVEILRIGTYRKDWGGVPKKDICQVLESEATILIPQIEIVPTALVENEETHDLELRFDMDPDIPNFRDPRAPLPVNWQLRFLHNQLFRHFQFPSRYCPGAFHCTLARNVEFRSAKHRAQYFEKCDRVIQSWQRKGPQPLETMQGGLSGQPSSGLYLFTDRKNVTHFFKPNFMLPRKEGEDDEDSEKKIVLDVLREEWDEHSLSWKPCGKGSMTRTNATKPSRRSFASSLRKSKPRTVTPPPPSRTRTPTKNRPDGVIKRWLTPKKVRAAAEEESRQANKRTTTPTRSRTPSKVRIEDSHPAKNLTTVTPTRSRTPIKTRPSAEDVRKRSTSITTPTRPRTPTPNRTRGSVSDSTRSKRQTARQSKRHSTPKPKRKPEESKNPGRKRSDSKEKFLWV